MGIPRIIRVVKNRHNLIAIRSYYHENHHNYAGKIREVDLEIVKFWWDLFNFHGIEIR